MLTLVKSLPLLFVLLWFCDGSVRIRLRDKHGLLGIPSLPTTNKELPPDHWFNQTLDHFEPTDPRTWKQRYHVVWDYYQKGGPVFLLIGGEGEASPKWMVKGAWIEYAKKYNALLFQLEHRFYGKSHPTSDLSVENLKYLTSEQALADLATFIVAMRSQYKLPSNIKWVAFGGSYPGNLAAWMRYKYPHLVHASMSASGPLFAQVDFPEYMDVVKTSLATHSDACVEAVEAAIKHINIMLKTPIGQATILKEFRLCTAIDNSNSKDVANFFDTLAGPFADVVQYNRDNRDSKTSNITIDSLCDVMVDESLGTPFIRLAAVNDLWLKTNDNKCLNFTYETYIEEMKNTTLDTEQNARQWMYQTCAEFGFYQTSERKNALFGETFPIDFFTQQCRDIFGETFSNGFIYNAVDRTNTMDGGLDIQATRVVYVHGSIDPWHALGITKTRIPESPAIFINGTAHCANMYTPADTDLPALKDAREQISALIGKWLQET